MVVRIMENRDAERSIDGAREFFSGFCFVSGSLIHHRVEKSEMPLPRRSALKSIIVRVEATRLYMRRS